MKIGYPCKNLSLAIDGPTTFRLASYSDQRLTEVITNNLRRLQAILEFNAQHGLLFFRITSDLVPFASHPVCTLNWREQFKDQFSVIGKYIADHSIRISMHPGQYVLLNSPRPDVVECSMSELQYHADVLDLLNLDTTAKLQIHVGGSYNNRPESVARFVEAHSRLPNSIKRRLCIENDERQYTLDECLRISTRTDGLPVIFDVFHHSLHNRGEAFMDAFNRVKQTWRPEDGIPMLDYSTQDSTKQRGAHTFSIDLADFRHFIEESKQADFDLMLEIKDKENSALAALEAVHELRPIVTS